MWHGSWCYAFLGVREVSEHQRWTKLSDSQTRGKEGVVEQEVMSWRLDVGEGPRHFLSRVPVLFFMDASATVSILLYPSGFQQKSTWRKSQSPDHSSPNGSKEPQIAQKSPKESREAKPGVHWSRSDYQGSDLLEHPKHRPKLPFSVTKWRLKVVDAEWEEENSSGGNYSSNCWQCPSFLSS